MSELSLSKMDPLFIQEYEQILEELSIKIGKESSLYQALVDCPDICYLFWIKGETLGYKLASERIHNHEI